MDEFKRKPKESSIKSRAELYDDDFAAHPFELEFDKQSIVNPSIQKDDLEKRHPDSFDDDDFFNLLLQYDEDKHREQTFSGYMDKDEEISYSEQLQNKFRDFLELRKISGKAGNYPKTNFIPSRNIIDKGEVMEITDDPKLAEHEKSSTVLVHRDKQGEAKLIEVLCSCGKRTFIRLNYHIEIPAAEGVSSGEVNYKDIIGEEKVFKEIITDKPDEDTIIAEDEYQPNHQESIESNDSTVIKDDNKFQEFEEASPFDADSASFKDYNPESDKDETKD